MGIEDPEKNNMVGTEANSINPDTGLPEFFLKDIFDKVGDVIRKVAKPVLTVASNCCISAFCWSNRRCIRCRYWWINTRESFEEAVH